MVLERLHRARRPPVEIDISPPRRSLLLPDSRALMEELEEAPDPFFGIMGVELPQVQELLPPEEPPGGAARGDPAGAAAAAGGRRSRSCPIDPFCPIDPVLPHKTRSCPIDPEPVSLPHTLRRTPNELLGTPCHPLLPPELRRLWTRLVRPLPRPPEPPPEPPSEVEVLREALEPSLPPPSSELSLEPMEEEPSIPPLPAPPPEVLPEVPEAPALDLRRLILDHAQLPEGAELAAILDPAWPRPLVARAFALCLELCASHWLQLEQPRPYGPIRIKLRPQRQ
ncbi:meiotic recombination protein REC8 homolog [Poecile atricapillus]|uniref:meiotic recombination protein REC8 homolog n=1 Tax=Poecile atricapillus TaxID=48891 RepID=UPI002738FD13|nr:meiotic recombination protein REC8 homolog [Poecile atricapillus]